MTQTHARRWLAAVAAGGLVVAPLTMAQAASSRPAAHAKGQKVVVSGLDSPREIQFGGAGRIYVSSLSTGNVVRSAGNGGHGTTIFTRAADSGVTPFNATTTYLLRGEGGGKGGASLYVGNPQTGKFHKLVSLLAYEKAHNPDGQKQCVGKGCDSESNPFALLKTTHDILIADAGANDILAYRPSNHTLHTYHVFPNIRDTKACKNAKNNDPRHPGCDPVPTGMALGPNGTLFVSLLGAESPNAAKVVELDLQTGALIRSWGHMSSVDGVAVSPAGVVYASELEYGLNPKKPNFDKTGRIVRIENGHRSYVQVATPAGLAWHDGHLYAASHSLDALFGHIKGAGVVVRVAQSAFH